MTHDFVVVGAGMVGLAVAYTIKKRHPLASVLVIEKEAALGMHASGRNSGVLHCGIYYGSETLKAKVCAQGAARMMQFAEEHHIAYAKSGKIILATEEKQLPTIERLMHNASQNGIRAQRLSMQEVWALEPAAAEGPAAIYCPDTAVIDAPAVLQKLYTLLKQQGVQFLFQCHVQGAQSTQRQLITTQGKVPYGFLFNCAGAYADQLAHAVGLAKSYALIPFKGIYWKLSPEAAPLVRANIYPVPDVSLPFLGVHLTRVINGEVYAGPTAIPVLGRENYHRLQGLNIKEAATIATHLSVLYGKNHQNFRHLAHVELAKYCKQRFFELAQALVPALTKESLRVTPKTGIRPQLINSHTGTLEMDYLFEQDPFSFHVLNAISPAFTSAFSLAELIVQACKIV